MPFFFAKTRHSLFSQTIPSYDFSGACADQQPQSHTLDRRYQYGQQGSHQHYYQYYQQQQPQQHLYYSPHMSLPRRGGGGEQRKLG